MEERYTAIKQACLVVRVDDADYARAVVAAQPTLTALGVPAATAAAAERYTLGTQDCITFARKVATALAIAGLKVPPRAALDTPAAWIERLKSASKI